MGRIVVSEFVTLDGVIEDPGGAEKSPYGGWAVIRSAKALAAVAM